jgi:hypothetical protein
MSRSGYSEDCDGPEGNLWRGAVQSAIEGRRGQKFLRELLAALEAMPEKRLIQDELVARNGAVCAMGAIVKQRGVDVSKVDPEDRHQVARVFNIAPALAAEVAWENDEGNWSGTETPEQRYDRMVRWVKSNIKGESEHAGV